MNDVSYIGVPLEEIEQILMRNALKISSHGWYEIILRDYCFGLFQRKLYIMCDNKGIIHDYYYRTDIR